MKHLLVANKWRTPDGTLLWSKHRHDYVNHEDSNGDYYFIDGGNDYIRMSKNEIPMKDECVYADDPFEEVRQNEFRGALIKEDNGNMYHKFIPIRCMSDAHLCNTITYVLKGVKELKHYDIHLHLYVKELMYRLERGLFLGDQDYTKMDIEAEPEYENVSVSHMDNVPSCVTVTDIVEALNDNSVSKELIHSNTTEFVLASLDKKLEELSEKEGGYAFMG